jgi:predicted CoA-binding protein
MSPEPMAPPDRVLMELLAARPLIALVGASPRIERPSHVVMRQLLEQRYPVIPVNPNEREVLGLPCYPDLRSVARRIGLVDVFRRAEATPEIARAAVEVGARTLWLQLGVVSDEAATIARAGGLTVVMDRCTMIEHERLLGLPFPAGGPAHAPPDAVGLCHDCRHARQVPAADTTYWLCRRSVTDPSFPKYPALPVRVCRGFQWGEG